MILTWLGKRVLALFFALIALITLVIYSARTRGPVAFIIYQPRAPNCAVFSGCPGRMAIFDPQTGNRVQWLEDANISMFVVSPRGHIAAYFANNISLASLNGGSYRLLQNGINSEPAWSPDGKELAFYSYDAQALLIVDAARTYKIQLTNGLFVRAPVAWSPDGSQIAFRAFTGPDGSGVYLINHDGSGLHKIPHTTPDDAFPQWLPDGKSLLLNKDDAQFTGLDVLHLDIGQRVHLVDTIGRTWLLSNNRLLYIDRDSPPYVLKLWNLDTNTSTDTAIQMMPINIDVSPDGSQILYKLYDPDDPLDDHLCIYNIDTHTERCFDDLNIFLASEPVWVGLP